MRPSQDPAGAYQAPGVQGRACFLIAVVQLNTSEGCGRSRLFMGRASADIDTNHPWLARSGFRYRGIAEGRGDRRKNWPTLPSTAQAGT